ncbi:Gfo/Idh/MocA family protein [Horticoccus sp. 23ND18S-11]|uniref:Gfo/Idh/MocA family protein n=1 Tax=Horticoccus sp. 23ND18S-11 TaxID=3391832 RepID=UPI0039C8FD45
MTQTYRAVLVGTGSVADSHARAIEETRGRVQLVSAVDVERDRVNAFCARHKIAIARTDYEQALREDRPDIVLVAAPPSLHAAMSIAAMESGAWVLCEKPLCASLAELDRIAEAEVRTGRYTACVFQQRFASSTAHLRRLAAEGLLGRPLVAVCHTLWYRDSSYYAIPWRGKWTTELGGPTMGLGIHAMDHLLHILGDWAEVRAHAATLDRAIEVEDVSMALVRFANGALASVVNSALSPRQETSIRLDYQRATVELTHLYGYTRDNWKLTLAPTAAEEGNSLVQAWQHFPPDFGSTHAAQLAEFVADRDAGRRPSTSGDDARRTLELMTALYKSAFTGKPVLRGTILPGDPFYTALHGGMAAGHVGRPRPEPVAG